LTVSRPANTERPSWWDDRIGDGNDFQTLLIEPATHRLLDVHPGDAILDLACGAGRFTRQIAERGARVVAFDYSAAFVARARERTPKSATIEFHVAGAGNPNDLITLGATTTLNEAVCTMALMDMPEIRALFAALSTMLAPTGTLVRVFSYAPMFPLGKHRAVRRSLGAGGGTAHCSHRREDINAPTWP
jgi:SAM-dependent methyltransferase